MARGNHLNLLQGSWSITDLEVDGRQMPEDMLAQARIGIQGSRFTNTGMGAVYEGTLKLDSSTNPKQIDMRFDAGPEKGNTNRGIYELDRDIWRLCLATRGAARPSKFVSPPGSGFALETLTRGEAEAVKSTKTEVPSPASGPATEFEGEWSLVSAIMDGKPMAESMVQWVKRVTHGNQATVYAGSQVMLQVEFLHDSSTTPKTIDYLNTAGRTKGKTQYGIYEYQGALLTFHVAPPGAARPTHFNPGPKDRSTLTIWKRMIS